MDRNYIIKITGKPPRGSLSARRAWIEITVVGVLATLVTASLSARRAWIEINDQNEGTSYSVRVALRKESVDRNTDNKQLVHETTGRSPQGERG